MMEDDVNQFLQRKTFVYSRPVCRGCGEELMVIEEHIHQFMRNVTPGGKTARPFNLGFRHLVDETLRCPKCGNSYHLLWDIQGRILRGRKIRMAAHQPIPANKVKLAKSMSRK